MAALLILSLFRVIKTDSLSPHCASEFTVFLSRLCSREDLKEKHQPILSEFMSRKDEGQKHAPPSLSRCVEKMPTCGESTLARVSQTIYFITVWSDTTSTAFPLSQGCTRSLCLILCREVFWSQVLPGAKTQNPTEIQECQAKKFSFQMQNTKQPKIECATYNVILIIQYCTFISLAAWLQLPQSTCWCFYYAGFYKTHCAFLHVKS